MGKDSKATPLKVLQGHMWREAYSNGDVKGQWVTTLMISDQLRGVENELRSSGNYYLVPKTLLALHIYAYFLRT